jgi:ABC-type proline/glycine betaine transport system permease subunit
MQACMHVCASHTALKKFSLDFDCFQGVTDCIFVCYQEKLRNPTVLHDIVNSFIVEFPSICVLALLGGYATCGTDFEAGAYDTNIFW